MPDLTKVQELASPLVSRASLVEVRLFESHGRHVKFQSDGRRNEWSDLGVNINHTSEADSGSAVFLMQAEIALQETDDEESSGEAEVDDLATFSVTYGALYSVEGEPDSLTPEMLEAFGQCVASLTMWPYIRAEMARLSEAMHATPMTLPMLTQRDLVELTE
jgi:hypothetical protein